MTEQQSLGEQILTALGTLSNARDPEHGSLLGARAFDKDQLAIQRNFHALLLGLGRPGNKHMKLMHDPVLSPGFLHLAEPLPSETVQVNTDQDWWFVLADAKPADGGRVLEHWAITINPPTRRLIAVDENGRPVAIGYPTIAASVK